MAITQTKKVVGVSAGLVATVALVYHLFFVTSGFSGVYGNKISTWIGTDAGRAAEVKWLIKNGFTSDYLYGVDGSYLSSATNRANISDFILKYRRAGGQEVGFVTSNITSLQYLDNYMKTASDSTRFNVIITEYEQYQTGQSRPFFYSLCKSCSDFCKKYNMKFFPYQGWSTQQDCDTVAKYADGVLLHAYGQYDKQSNVGAWIYGYSKSRVTMYTASYKALQKKAMFSVITSTENPDQTKTQFGYKYYTAHGWMDTYNSFASYWNAQATTDMKAWISYRGQITFVEDQAKQIKP